ncbi:MAG: class I SAM-dependent methyltransferase [Chitinophagales bacterium]
MNKTLKWELAQRVELLWWQKYLRRKSKDEYTAWKKGYWNEVLQKVGNYLQMKPKDKVLDAGCGPAGIFMVLPQQEVTAVDPLLLHYQNKLAHFSPADYPYVQFHDLPLEQFQSPNSYDVVFCMNAINHVSDIEDSFDRLVEAVLPNGTLVVSIDAHNYNFLKHLFRMLPGDILHPHQYDLVEYQNMLTKRGCEITSCQLIQKNRIFDHYVLVAKKREV